MYDSSNPQINKWLKYGIATAVVLIALVALSPLTTIQAGHRGVVLNWGAVSGKVLNEGLHFRIPVVQKIVKFNVQTVKMEVQASAYSKDIQTVEAIMALNYHVNPEGVNTLYQTIGKDYESRIISPAVQESVKAATAKYTAQELVEKRAAVKDEIKASLISRLSIENITVDEVSIVNFDFSDEYETAVEGKQKAQQDALKAENDLKRVKFEAEQRVAQATAEAEAIRIQAQAITQQGGANYVQLKAVEKWDGQLPTQFVPGSSVPFLQLN